MTEADARAWIVARWGEDRAMMLDRYVAMLMAESERQNLISRASFDHVWSRHIVDSAQLVPLSQGAGDGAWVDIGSGAGLPGIVVAILQARPVIMIEPRRKRVEFLDTVVTALSLNATAVLGKVEAAAFPNLASVISARAVASLDKIFSLSASIADGETLWLLPKGRSADAELEEAHRRWKGVFHVEQSLTAEDSKIVIANRVKRA